MKEGIIGIIYRHGCNDYEFMIGNFPKEMRDDIEGKVMAFDDGYNLAGARGDKRMCLEDANIDHFERNEWIQICQYKGSKRYRNSAADI